METEQPTNGKTEAASVELENEVRSLRDTVAKQEETMRLLLARQRAERAVVSAKQLVLDGKIAPAQEADCADLFVSMTEEQREKFDKFVGNNQIAPLGGVDAADAGREATEGSILDLSRLSNREVELMAAAEATLVAEQKGWFGPDAQKKHQKDPMGFYPVKGGET